MKSTLSCLKKVICKSCCRETQLSSFTCWRRYAMHVKWWVERMIMCAVCMYPFSALNNQRTENYDNENHMFTWHEWSAHTLLYFSLMVFVKQKARTSLQLLCILKDSWDLLLSKELLHYMRWEMYHGCIAFECVLP